MWQPNAVERKAPFSPDAYCRENIFLKVDLVEVRHGGGGVEA